MPSRDTCRRADPAGTAIANYLAITWPRRRRRTYSFAGLASTPVADAGGNDVKVRAVRVRLSGIPGLRASFRLRVS